MSQDLTALFRGRDVADRRLDMPLPAGRIVCAEYSDQMPALWLSDGPAEPGWWRLLQSAHPVTGLWPLVLGGLYHDMKERPWAVGELWPQRMSDPASQHAEDVLERLWKRRTELADGVDPNEEGVVAIRKTLDPFGWQWPGLSAARPTPIDEPAAMADGLAEALVDRGSRRLGLVACDRGADALAVAGWFGPANHTNDTGELCTVLRSWEDRFGVRVVGADFATLYLSVVSPPQTYDEAIGVAAEHFAFCPDNVWQSDDGTLAKYALSLIDVPIWHFWWD
jgi:hypothetical protein